MELHQAQKKIVSSNARFKIIRAGRRGGKSVLEVEEMLFAAVEKKDRIIFYIAPTQLQARDIIWEILKSRVGTIGKANESRLEMRVPTQDGGTSVIRIGGWENRENFRGKAADLIVFDEVDTMRDFFIGYQEIFRPALTDRKGRATFIGTPKKENPNLRRLEKVAETDVDYEAFHYTTYDNPHIDTDEIEKAKEELDANTFKQEYMAEYVDNQGALFKYSAIVDLFSNTITKNTDKFLIVDIADDGSDKTIFTFWNDLEVYRVEQYSHMNTETIISQIREYAAEDKIPYSQIAVDAIGVGAGVASSSLLDGIIGYKSSYAPLKTDQSIVLLPNQSYTNNAKLSSDYRNLRSQCVFTLADLTNNHKIAIKVEDVKVKEAIIEELATYQDVSKGDGKRLATLKEDVKSAIGRSPDISDTLIMRMFFVVRSKLVSGQSPEDALIRDKQQIQFDKNFNNKSINSSR